MEKFLLSLKAEFDWPEAELNSRSLMRAVSKCFQTLLLIMIAHIIFRSLVTGILFVTDWFPPLITELNSKYWFDALLLIFLTYLVVFTVVRLISPIRTASKVRWTCFIIFGIYLVEKVAVKQFEFLPSNFLAKKWDVKIDYFAFVILPIVFEIPVRILYAARREARINRSLFFENRPIAALSEDRTTRKLTINQLADQLHLAEFDNSFSIGIVADWGVGKTSFIRTLEKGLSPDFIVIHFNPWLATSKASLIEEFINSLKEKLRLYDGEIGFSLQKYLNSLIEIEKATKTTFARTVNEFVTDGYSSVTELERVRRSIKKINRKIIVFVDDLDRLDHKEIIEVLKLIRNTGDFSNTIYISCYDKIYLLNALKNFTQHNLNIVLEKFFDIEIPLAPIPPGEFLKDIETHFFVKYGIGRTDRNDLNKLIENSFSQFRDVKRFLVMLRFDYELYGKQLYVKDFFLFTLLKARYPFLPSLMWARKNEFFQSDSAPAIWSLTVAEYDGDGVSLQGQLSIGLALESYSQEISKKDKIFILEIVHQLFPSKPYGHPLAIQELNAFDSYFYNSIPDSSLPSRGWFTLIQNGKYREHSLFSRSHEIKTENAILDDLLAESEIQTDFLAKSPDKLFEFFLFLIDWSEGQISSHWLPKLYKLVSINNKPSHFAAFVLRQTGEAERIMSRVKFVTAIIRKCLYENKTHFEDVVSLNDLKRINHDLFNIYLSLITSFTNETFQMLYNQVGFIDDNRRVTLHSPALTTIRAFINKHFTGFLDNNIRSFMVPNSDLIFAFAPFTLTIFEGSIESFRNFVSGLTTYHPYRREKMLSYLAKSRVENASIRFLLDEAEFSSMPIQFQNAYHNVSNEIKQRVGQLVNRFPFKFVDQPSANKAFNDHRYLEAFKIEELTMLQLRIIFNSGLYWRLGLKFARTSDFPITNVRHLSDKPDVVIKVGDLDDHGKWSNSNRLDIKEYQIEPVSHSFRPATDYDRSEVLATYQFQREHDYYILHMSINYKGNDLGFRRYHLKGIEYFHVSAWCDNHQFDLDVEIIVTKELLSKENSLNADGFNAKDDGGLQSE